MAATTTLLGLVTPTQGTLSGTWGDTVNYGISDYVDIAVAGTLTLTGDGAVTLANTTGSSSGSNITSTLAGAGTVTAQFSTVRVSGTTTTKVVTGPSYSKSYLVDNASSFAVTFKASGQTGVSISPSEKVYVYYNATDYVKVGGGGITYGAVKTTTYTAVANDGVLTNTTSAAFTVNLPATPSTGTQVFIADSAGTWATNNLTIGRNGSTIAGSATDLVCDINSVSIQCIYDGTTWDIFAQIGANDTAVVTLNGTQTLTNKTLTAPTITSPTVTGTGTIAAATVTLSSTLSVTGVSTLTGGAVIQGLTVGRGAGAIASNMAVGLSALGGGSQTGIQNTAVGYQAMLANTSGSYNTAFGFTAMTANTTGEQNAAFGREALQSNTTGNYNAASGMSALRLNTTGNNNSAFGFQSLSANTTASNNVAVGYQALHTNTTGPNNVSVGYQALYANTTGDSQVAVGYTALKNNTTGYYSVALGHETLFNQTTGGSNTAAGFRALKAVTTQTDNSAFGSQALIVNTGSGNTAVGSLALYSNTTGSNTAVGYAAMSTNTTGTNNTAVGREALTSSTTADNNTIMGYYAGGGITTGSQNVFIGQQSGYYTTATTTGAFNIYIGSLVRGSAAGNTSEIVISANVAGKGSSTGFISPGGGGVYQGNNSSTWSTTSDQRLKKNIADNHDGLDKITSIRVRNFEYRLAEEVTDLQQDQAIQKSGVQLGVIAQELQAFLPECVKTESTGVMSVDTDNLTWYLVNAIKQQQAIITTLTERITALEA